jgi:SAM-dependent methyltransferase
MSEDHPALVEKHPESYPWTLDQQPYDMTRFDRMLTYLDRLVDLSPPKDVLVIGCGPRPHLIEALRARGHRAIGVEPVVSFVAAANEYLGVSDSVMEGCAEKLPVRDATFDLVLCEYVLEHVDSPRATLDEMYRVLRPGRIAFVTTNNRSKLSLEAPEFNVRFLNWFPRLVRESYAFRHLHYDPALARYTTRPAVHWFTFSELCVLGRYSGFAHCYSPLDLLAVDDPIIAKSWLLRFLLRPVQRNPWLRALALTQVGHGIIMLKRPEP